MKRIIIAVSCVAIVLGAVLFTNSGSIQASNVNEVYTKGDFTYRITKLGNGSENGKVEITSYDETSSVTAVEIPNTVILDGDTYDVETASDGAFTGATKVVSIHIPENLIEFDGNEGFWAQNFSNYSINSSLKTISVDEQNPVFKIINGVLYNTVKGKEKIALYPYGSEQKTYVAPDFIVSDGSTVDADSFSGLSIAKNLENIVLKSETPSGVFTKNGIMYRWIDKNDHTLGTSVIVIPKAKKKVEFQKDIKDFAAAFSAYVFQNDAEEFVIESGGTFKSIDGAIYEGNSLCLYPGGRKDSVYELPNTTKSISATMPFVANNSLKSLIIPSSVDSIGKWATFSNTLKSIKIEGEGNIVWHASNFEDAYGDSINLHIYYENGKENVKTKMQNTFSQLGDNYFHELGAIPTTRITGMQTIIQNEKDVKITWNSSEPATNFEVRRYNTKTSKYEVLTSTTETSFIDTNTAYNTSYQYEVVPYSLPITSSNDEQDPLYNYRTYGTASNKIAITTSVLNYKGTYIFKQTDGTEKTVLKDVQENTSAILNAPSVPKIQGYRFDKWITNLTNVGKVNKNFTATASYVKTYTYTYQDDNGKTIASKTVDVGSDIRKTIPTAPIKKGYTFVLWDYSTNDVNLESINKDFTAKAVYKINASKPGTDADNKPDTSKDSVKTGDTTNIHLFTMFMIVSGIVVVTSLRKKYSQL